MIRIYARPQSGRYNIGGGGITVSPFTCQVKSTLKKTGLWPPMYPLTSTNHREEMMIRLYNYSSKLSIIILDWHWANSGGGGGGVEPRRFLSWFHTKELMPPPPLASIKQDDQSFISIKIDNRKYWASFECDYGVYITDY